jgi:hypothetical protein
VGSIAVNNNNIHLLNYLIYGKNYLTESILNQIFSIANQCVHNNSYAIFICRSLCNLMNIDSFDDNNCSVIGIGQLTAVTMTNPENSIAVIPNPN